MRLASAWLFYCSLSLGQNPVKFDVSSIKRELDFQGVTKIDLPTGGSFTTHGMVVKLLIMNAYPVSEYQIIGAPDWTETERYEIKAKAEVGDRTLTEAEVLPMLQALLKDRFGLKFHRETRRLPVYALVVAKGGAKLKPAAELTPGRPSGVSGAVGYGLFRGVHTSLTPLTQMLASALGRPVVDKTGLKGEYDFTVEFVKNSVPDPGIPGLRRTFPEPAPDAEGPSLFTAFQEQLGLRFEAETGPVEVLVIDAIQRPGEN